MTVWVSVSSMCGQSAGWKALSQPFPRYSCSGCPVKVCQLGEASCDSPEGVSTQKISVLSCIMARKRLTNTSSPGGNWASVSCSELWFDNVIQFRFLLLFTQGKEA